MPCHAAQDSKSLSPYQADTVSESVTLSGLQWFLAAVPNLSA
ncbi:hypothetical protein [Thiomicrorhabdus aquaedulcis]|nr:hypothetical protein [Thiomicrorhabdus aquaedulcis]